MKPSSFVRAHLAYLQLVVSLLSCTSLALMLGFDEWRFEFKLVEPSSWMLGGEGEAPDEESNVLAWTLGADRDLFEFLF